MTLSDELLLQYVDGALAPAEASAVAAALARDRVAAERVRLMIVSGAALKAEARRSPDATFVPTLNPPRARPTWYRNRGLYQAIAACLMLAIGIGLGTALVPRESSAGIPTWIVRVADYHTLYARRTVEGHTLSAAAIRDLETRLSSALGRSFRIPIFDAGVMEFRRGQILEFEQAPVIQLAYLPETGSPIAVCLKHDAGPDTEPTIARVNGIGLARWRSRGLGFVVVGHKADADLLTLARGVAAQQAPTAVN